MSKALLPLATALAVCFPAVATPLDYVLPHVERRITVHEVESLYFLIRVEDDESGRRHLVFLPNRGSQSVIFLDRPDELASEFMKHMFLALPALGRAPQDVLFVGLGGGVMPGYLQKRFPSARIDVVELDGAVPKVAAEFFGFKPGKSVQVVLEDGRVFANRNRKRYDLVFVDTYNAEAIPFHLTTVEFHRKLKEALKPDGVLAINLATWGQDKFAASELRTLRELYGERMAVFALAHHYIPLLSPEGDLSPATLERRAAAYDQAGTLNFSTQALLPARLPPEELLQMEREEGAVVLTDEKAPVGLN